MWIAISDVVKKEFVRYYQKILATNKVIPNADIETWDLSKSKIQVTENFAYRGETYPVVVVSAEGGKILVRGFRDDIGENYYLQDLGITANDYIHIGKHGSAGDVAALATYFKPTETLNLQQVGIYLSNNGIYSQGDLTVKLYHGGSLPGSGSLIASGTIEGFSETTAAYKYVGIEADVTAGDGYWLLVESDADSGYYGYIDSTNNAADTDLAARDTLTGDWVLSSDRAMVSSIKGDVSSVLGGDASIPIVIQVAAYDIKTVDMIFDLLLLWTELAKRYEYSDFLDKHIRIESINFGGDTAPRELNANTQIFVKQFTVGVVGAWNYEIDRDLLSGFGFNINSF